MWGSFEETKIEIVWRDNSLNKNEWILCPVWATKPVTCTPTSMGKTIAAVFLRLSAVIPRWAKCNTHFFMICAA